MSAATAAVAPVVEEVARAFAAAIADEIVGDDDERRRGAAVVLASYAASAPPPEAPALDGPEVDALVAEVERVVLDEPERPRRDRIERRVARLAAEVAGAGVDVEDDAFGYFLLCADAGEVLAATLRTRAQREARERATARAAADEVERRGRRRARRAERRGQQRAADEPESVALVLAPGAARPQPTEAQRADLALALALLAQASPAEAPAAMALVRETALAAHDDATAAWAKAKLRELRRLVA